MAKNEYSCTQFQLYTTAETAWSLFLLHIGDFTAFRKSYSIQFYEERMKELNYVRELKDRKTLQKELTLAKANLIKAKDDVLHCYKCLVEYTDNVLYKHYHHVMKDAKNYRRASNNNWKAALIITDSCAHVLNKCGEDLVANDYLPLQVANELEAKLQNFRKSLKEFSLAKHNLHSTSVSKVFRGNQLYKELTTMLRHAQLIYRDKPEMQELFCFDRMVKKRNNKKEDQLITAKQNPLMFLSKVAGMFL